MVSEARKRLTQDDPEFRRLFRRHEEYDERLKELQHCKFLTDEEQVEEVELKKRKLALKDQMEALVRKAEG